MGLEKNEGRKIYLNISDGKIVRQHQNPVEGVTASRTNKNGKVVHEEKFSAVTGYLKEIRSKETPFGKVWEVSLTDDGEDFVLSWNYSSKYSNHFFRALPNVNLSEKVSLHPWSMKDKQDASKTAIGLSLYQNKTKIEFYYTKESPGDMPELKKIKVKGKESWDDSAQLDFYEEMVKNISFCKPAAPAALATVTDGEPDEELPF